MATHNIHNVTVQCDADWLARGPMHTQHTHRLQLCSAHAHHFILLFFPVIFLPFAAYFVFASSRHFSAQITCISCKFVAAQSPLVEMLSICIYTLWRMQSYFHRCHSGNAKIE